jgi:hypothetical protein
MRRSKVLLISSLLFWFGAASQARIFLVTNTRDTTETGSLRGALLEANRLGGHNVILLRANKKSSPVFHLTIAGANEDRGRTGDLDITSGDVTIIGSGPNATIDAEELGDRVFQVFPNAHLRLSRLTIRGGRAPDTEWLAFGRGYGGAIYNAGSLALQNCIITNSASGHGTPVMGNGGGTQGGDGGAIYNSGKLVMNKCLVQGNFCGTGFDGGSGGSGGAIRNDGSCTLSSCVINQNQSGHGGPAEGNFNNFGGWGGQGGGIYNSGTMTLAKCVVSGNASGQGAEGVSDGPAGGDGGWGGVGGGIYNSGKMLLKDSSICGNAGGNAGNGGAAYAGSAGGIGGLGGGIANIGELTAIQCTISMNLGGTGGNGGNGYLIAESGRSGGGGGGVYNAGALNFTACTIVMNRAGNGGTGGTVQAFSGSGTVPGGGLGGAGGGILNVGTNVLRNTLIALNSAGAGGQGGTNIPVDAESGVSPIITGNPGSDGGGPDTFGNFLSGGFNLVGAADANNGLTNGSNADLIGGIASPLDPLIGPLQINGGSTPTHALLPGSPAIDQGNSFGIRKDQRGQKRPYDYSSIPNASSGNGTDIGAYESQ